MNTRILKISFLINIISIIGFAASMPLRFDFGNYIFSIFIALSFLIIICSFNYVCDRDKKLPGIIALSLCVIYGTIILLVYFGQLTTVRFTPLSSLSAHLLDFKEFGLMFNYDLLGYSMMSLSAFFSGLTVNVNSKADLTLKTLLLLNAVFFVSCFVFPLTGLLTSSSENDGILILEIWCVFFSPISVLSYNYLNRKLSRN